MKHTALALSAFLAGCGASVPSAPVASTELMQCAPERTLQDELNSVYVTLSTRYTPFQTIIYGDMSHFFDVRADADEKYLCSYDSCGLRFDLYHGDPFHQKPGDISLQFKDGAPFTSLNSVTICRYDNTVSRRVCEPPSNTKDMNFLHETYETLIQTTIDHFNNQKDLALEKKLMDAYDVIRLNEGY
ncbi:MAG: hypothetical protein AABX64_00760 [Nanoarchaeota archaeon]